jgi:hypothetical protein
MRLATTAAGLAAPPLIDAASAGEAAKMLANR